MSPGVGAVNPAAAPAIGEVILDEKKPLYADPAAKPASPVSLAVPETKSCTSV